MRVPVVFPGITLLVLLRLFHTNPVATYILIVKAFDGCPGLARTRHFNEAKALGFSCHLIHHQLAVLHIPVSPEQGQQLRFRRFPGQIAHQYFHVCTKNSIHVAKVISMAGSIPAGVP